MDPGTPPLGKVHEPAKGLMDHGLAHVVVAFHRTWCTPKCLDAMQNYGKTCLVHQSFVIIVQ